MRAILQDLRYGARMLLKKPGVTGIAIITLALGIGANTAILGTVNGLILRPLPVTDPGQLVQPFQGSIKDTGVWNNFSYPNYIDLRDQNRSFSGLLAWQTLSAGISNTATGRENTSEAGEIVWGQFVSENFFDVLGVKAAVGRAFTPEEDRTPGTHPVAVIGNSLWQRRFNADPAIVGKTVYLDGHPFTVIGVAPQTFEGLDFAYRQEFWIPLMMQTQMGVDEGWINARGWQNLRLLGRLKPGVTMLQAQADLNLIAERLGQLYPDTNADTKIQVVSQLDGRLGEASSLFRFMSLIALAVAGLVLLVACANVANLLLARAGARSREIGIRLSIGAGRFQIVRQLLVESLLLALLGGGLGLLFAFWGTDLIRASIPPLQVQITLNFSPDLLVLKWIFLVTLLTGVVFGLAPALVASRADLVSVLKSNASGQGQLGGSRRWNVRSVLVIAQVALSIIVLVCAGLFVRSLARVKNADPGFSTENLVTMKLSTGPLGYSKPEGKQYFREVVRRVKAQPGVRSASMAAFMPLGNSNDGRGPVIREGEALPPPSDRQYIDINVVTPGYFDTMKTALLFGRDFTERDNDDAPGVAIVNQEFARRFYGGEQNALRRRFHTTGPGTPPVEIVGIAKDGLYENLFENPRPYIFLPEFQGDYQPDMTLLVSTSNASDVKPVVEAVRREIGQIDSRVPIFALQMGEQNLAWAYWGPKLAAGLATAFGLLALVLAATGLYGVMTYVVSRRTREVGIRMALGAQIRDILGMVIKQGMRMVFVGAALGLAGAFALTRLLSSLLFGVSATDTLTFAGVALLILMVAMLACYVPARRAAKVNPIVALRYE